MLMEATWAGHEKPHQGGKQASPVKLGSLFDCIRLRKAWAPSLSKLQFNSRRRLGLGWPGMWLCAAVFLGPGASPVAPRKAHWAKAGRAHSPSMLKLLSPDLLVPVLCTTPHPGTSAGLHG